MESPPPAADTILFRPSKKRKIYRQRVTENDDESPSTTTAAAPAQAPVEISNAQSLEELIASSAVAAEGEEVEGAQVSMAEILRLRKRNKRIGGVEFRAENQGHVSRDGEGALVVRQKGGGGEGHAQEQEGGISGVPRKFAPQTGTVGDVNKHMMAYIDSELAKRRAEGLQVSHSTTPPPLGLPTTSKVGKPPNTAGELKKPNSDIQRQPATLGKLLEIDLGDEARNRNVERTNQARRKLDGEEVEEDNEEGGKKAKVRLGRDGKPWRGRKRRGSEDIKRDKLVEEVLRENRLEIYDEPVVEPTAINDDQAADDRIAEAFRREFMDAVSQRQRKKTAPAAPPSRTAAGKKEEEALKGPKLGGSRNARAAMRDSMLKAGKK